MVHCSICNASSISRRLNAGEVGTSSPPLQPAVATTCHGACNTYNEGIWASMTPAAGTRAVRDLMAALSSRWRDAGGGSRLNPAWAKSRRRSPNGWGAVVRRSYCRAQSRNRRRCRRRQGRSVRLVATLMLSALDCVVFEFCCGRLVGIFGVFTQARPRLGIAWTGTSIIFLHRGKSARAEEHGQQVDRRRIESVW